MIFLKISLLLASLAVLILTIKTNSKITNIIVVAMITTVVMVQFPSLLHPGIVAYMAVVAIAFVYGFFIKPKTIGSKVILSVMSGSMFTYWLLTLNHWHGNTFLFLVLAFVTGVFGVIYRKDLKTEWGFLLILWVDSIDSIIEHLLKAGI